MGEAPIDIDEKIRQIDQICAVLEEEMLTFNTNKCHCFTYFFY